MISCITITQKNRLPFLKKSIEYFLNQTYKDKELVIGITRSDLSLLSNLNQYTNKPNIRFIELNDNISLGEKRNILISKSSGDYISIWDDDDYHSPERLEKQYNYCIEKNIDGCTLSSLIIYSQSHDEVKLSFERIYGWEGSLLCKKSIIGKYEDINCGEDTPMVEYIFKNNNLKTYFNPELYVYILHNSNTSDIRHIENMFTNSLKLNLTKNISIKKLIGHF